MLELIANIIGIIAFIWMVWEKLSARTIQTGSIRARTTRDLVIGSAMSLACAMLWSVSYVSLSYVSQRAGLLEISALMLLPAFVFLFLSAGGFYLYERKVGERFAVDIDWATWPPWIVIATNVANFLLFIYALYFVSASQTITLHKINPIFVAILTWLWLRERPTRLTISSVVLVVFAAVVIAADDHMQFSAGAPLTGSLLAITGGLTFAVFTVALDKIDRTNATRAGRLFFLGIVFFVSYSALVTVAYLTHKPVPLETTTLLILGGNGLRVALVYALYQAAIRRIGGILTSVIVALEVPLTMVFESVILDRPPSTRLIVGSIGVLAGAIVLATEGSPGRHAPAA